MPRELILDVDAGYAISVARNARLHRQVEAWEQELEAAVVRDGTKPRVIGDGRTLPRTPRSGWRGDVTIQAPSVKKPKTMLKASNHRPPPANLIN